MHKIIEELQTAFEEIEVDFAAMDFRGTVPVFRIVVPNNQYLDQRWSSISSVIAGKYQGSLDENQEFERWNIYIFFLCPQSIDSSLRGEIENDKFAARKIVIENVNSGWSVEDLFFRYISNERITKEAQTESTMDVRDEDGSKLKNIIGDDFIVDRYGNNQQKLKKLITKLEDELASEIN